MKALGVLCSKTGYQWALVETTVGGSELRDLNEQKVPANINDRAAQLARIRREFVELLAWGRPDIVDLMSAGTMGSADRNQVEGVLLAAASDAGVVARLRTKEQVRTAFGLAKAPGAYDSLHQRPDVKLGTSKSKRDVHLFALAALQDR